MGKWTDLAIWKGPTPNQGPEMAEVRGLVIHIAQGYLDGTLAWQKNPDADVSSHFIVGGPRDHDGQDGLCYQVVDTSTAAWTQANGNGHWLSIECSGFVPDKLSNPQIERIALIFAKTHEVYDVPLVLADDPSDKGLGHHSMGCNYGWGHCECPGTNIIKQKQKILDRAKQIVEGGDMALADDEWAALQIMAYRVKAIVEDAETVHYGTNPRTGKPYRADQPNMLHDRLNSIEDLVTPES